MRYWVLAGMVALPCGACLGGSTGQEGEEPPCWEAELVPPEQLQEMVELVEGSYQTSLYWVNPELSLPALPSEVEDAGEPLPLTMEVRYAGTETVFRYRQCGVEVDEGRIELPFVIDFRMGDERFDGQFLAIGFPRPDIPGLCLPGPAPTNLSAEPPDPKRDPNEGFIVYLADEADLRLPPWGGGNPMPGVDFFETRVLCINQDGEIWGNIHPTEDLKGVWPTPCGGLETRSLGPDEESRIAGIGTRESLGEFEGMVQVSVTPTGDAVCSSGDSSLTQLDVTYQIGDDSWTGDSAVELESGRVVGAEQCFELDATGESATALFSALYRSQPECQEQDPRNCRVQEPLSSHLALGFAAAEACVRWEYADDVMELDTGFMWYRADGVDFYLTATMTTAPVTTP